MKAKTTFTEDKDLGLSKIEVFMGDDCIMSRVCHNVNDIKNAAIEAIYCEEHAAEIHTELYPPTKGESK